MALFNRFGHGLSYDQIEEVETALVEQALTRDAEGVPLLSQIDRDVPVVFAADNNDLLEETPTGTTTTHCTNSIVVQRPLAPTSSNQTQPPAV